MPWHPKNLGSFGATGNSTFYMGFHILMTVMNVKPVALTETSGHHSRRKTTKQAETRRDDFQLPDWSTDTCEASLWGLLEITGDFILFSGS